MILKEVKGWCPNIYSNWQLEIDARFSRAILERRGSKDGASEYD